MVQIFEVVGITKQISHSDIDFLHTVKEVKKGAVQRWVISYKKSKPIMWQRVSAAILHQLTKYNMYWLVWYRGVS